MSFQPTPEQQAIYDAALTGKHLVIEAGAGSGKTTTLRGIATLPQMLKRGAYFAYNRAVANDAADSFPLHVRCKTGHGFCYGYVIQRSPWMVGRLRLPAQNGRVRAGILGLRGPTHIASGVAPLAPSQVARIALDTVRRFCFSGDDTLTKRHVPRQEGILGLHHPAVQAAILPVAVKAWEDILSPTGQLRWEHDFYVKMAQLAGVHFGAEYLFLDEAQDSNGVTVAIARTQAAGGTQVITVGDRMQTLYAWRGAENGMDALDGGRLFLTKSFRFGHTIAAEANKWLDALEADLRIKGHDPVDSVLAHLEPGQEDAVLCRTNAEAMRRVIAAHAAGRTVALVDGRNPGQQMLKLAEACDQFQAEGWTWHPELQGFNSWGEVLRYVDEDGGTELATGVKLIEEYGTDQIIDAVKRLTPEERASLVVSTAHRSKGREWDRVRIADDFREPKPDETGAVELDRNEGMLAYVAVTRAKKVLDRGPLSYIDQLNPVGAARATNEARERVVLAAVPDPEPAVCGAPRLDGQHNYPKHTWECDRPAGHLARGVQHGQDRFPGYDWTNPGDTLAVSA